MAVMEKKSEHYAGYEYMEVKVEAGRASMYIDGYRNFGWEQDENLNAGYQMNPYQKPIGRGDGGTVLLRLKRDRKLMNKMELTRLQRNFEDCMHQIDALEKSKTTKGLMVSLSIGLIGTVFMAGSTFAVTASPPVIWLCVLLAIPGFAGWILPYFCYKAIVAKRTQTVNPLIEEKYDEAYEICRKGSGLLGINENISGGAADQSEI